MTRGVKLVMIPSLCLLCELGIPLSQGLRWVFFLTIQGKMNQENRQSIEGKKEVALNVGLMLSSEQDRSQSLRGTKIPQEHAQGHTAAG